MPPGGMSEMAFGQALDKIISETVIPQMAFNKQIKYRIQVINDVGVILLKYTVCRIKHVSVGAPEWRIQ